jgi:hypothetical protein
MANASDYLEQSIYNFLFRNGTFAKPTPAIGLTLNVPNDSGAYVEVGAGLNYARWPNASGTNVWSAMTAPGSGENLYQTFSFGPASADWGTVSGVIICDSATVGQGNSNLLMHGALTSPRDVKQNDTFTFGLSALKISIQ